VNRRLFIKILLLFFSGFFFRPSKIMGQEKVMPSADKRKMQALPKVVRVFNNKATSWNYKTHPYINYINYDAVKNLLAKGLTTITETNNAKDAWKTIIHPYKAGEKIVIKPNFNNTGIGYSKAIMTSPQVIAAIVESLINSGFPAEDIIAYDLTAKGTDEIMPWLKKYPITVVFRREYKSLWDKIVVRLHFGQQNLDTSAMIKMRSVIKDDNSQSVNCYIPNVLTNAHHLINVPVFKAHQFVLQSSALKNHFGTVRFSNYNSYPVVLHGENIEKNIVDIYRSDHIKLKTRITIVDGLFGAGNFNREGYGRVPTPWNTLTTDPTPNSLFFSFDPIALESVLADYIIQEQEANGYEPNSHEYLHDAVDMGMGIHEHRNTKGEYTQIEYKEIVS
jgi:uncharacterized protein (DUF362 family)